MPHLLSVWPSVEKQLSAASRVFLFFDYDGTLTPIASRPELAELPLDTRSLLQELKARDKFVLGIVSGRDLNDVKGKVGVPGIIYAGNHGLEIEAAGERFLHPEAEARRGDLSEIYHQLRDELARFEGIILENKGLTLSVHYRLTPEDQIGQVQQVFSRIVSDLEKFRISRGKMVLEVRPNVPWDKGKAIAKIMEDYPPAELAGALPLFFGDDQTDEAGFEVVQNRQGIAVLVGPARQPTKALYRVDSPAEVSQVLSLLSQL